MLLVILCVAVDRLCSATVDTVTMWCHITAKSHLDCAPLPPIDTI